MTDLDLRRIFLNSVRVYFAPLTGAFKGIRDELRRTDPWRQHRRTGGSPERHHNHSSRG
ncbi:hypothetical protein [Acidovorax sp. sic0104]|uniref:hypothetical protein n=1 Tax=Acidovorax sp. sic0104 TaxID=2854784 RepID=UPI001C48B362|nr:hypothetical protein [Acidovorax sp. sic0104]MBV7542158.1 hypothetical protein [Acidovorax sp. sic0104]